MCNVVHGPKMVKNAEMGWLSRPLFEVGGYFYLKILVFITCMDIFDDFWKVSR